MNVLIEKLVKDIKSRTPLKIPVLIGIEGFGGSGKSTIARQLSELLGNSYVVNPNHELDLNR